MDLKINKFRDHDPDQSGLGEGHVLGCCKHGNELSGSIKLWEFLDQVRTIVVCKGLCCHGGFISNFRYCKPVVWHY